MADPTTKYNVVYPVGCDQTASTFTPGCFPCSYKTMSPPVLGSLKTYFSGKTDTLNVLTATFKGVNYNYAILSGAVPLNGTGNGVGLFFSIC